MSGSTTYTIEELDPGTEYTVRVTAIGPATGPNTFSVDGVGTPSHGSAGGVTGTPIPGKVKNVEVTAAAEELTVTWDEVSGAHRYTVQWKSGGQDYSDVRCRLLPETSPNLVLDPPEAITLSIDDLGSDRTLFDVGASYTVRVFATSASIPLSATSVTVDGESSDDRSMESSNTAKPAQVTTPTIKSGKDEPGPGKLLVEWKKVDGATGYSVEWRDPSSTPPEAWDEDGTATPFPRRVSVSGSDFTGTSYTISGLTGGTEYEVRVLASNAGGDGPYSLVARGRPALGKVGEVTVDVSVSEQLTVSWDVVTGAVGYKVEWRKSSEEEYDEDDVQETASTNHIIQDLDSGTEYTVRVTATQILGTGNMPKVHDGEASEEQTGLTVPAKVEIVGVTDGVAKLTVSWTALTLEPTGYKVQWRDPEEVDSWGEDDFTPTEGTNQNTVTASATRHIIEPLTADTEYAVRVIAYNASGDGTPSDEETGTPTEPLPVR